MSFKRAAVGGSFDVLHKGHRALLDRAFGASESVIIGLTSNEMAGKDIAAYEKRKEGLEEFLEPGHRGRYNIVELNDPLGDAAADEEIDAIVVSEETAPGALEINEARERKGLKALKIIQIPLVLAEDGRCISSTRIKRGEIDGEGRVLSGHK